jgi:hypothetical protein
MQLAAINWHCSRSLVPLATGELDWCGFADSVLPLMELSRTSWIHVSPDAGFASVMPINAVLLCRVDRFGAREFVVYVLAHGHRLCRRRTDNPARQAAANAQPDSRVLSRPHSAIAPALPDNF